MTVSEKHICPQCGAPLDQRTFVETCSFCGYVSMSSFDNNEEGVQVEFSPSEFFNYISRHLSYIQSECPVEIKKQGESYSIMDRGVFSPNDGRKVITDIILRYYATITKDTFTLELVVESEHNDRPVFYIQTEVGRILAPKVVCKKGRSAITITYEEFLALCEAESLEVDTNLITIPLVWDELKTYSRRFYHSIMDRSKYVYSLRKELYTDY